MGDLYDKLLKQPELEATRIAAALELYVTGSLNAFPRMLIVQDQVWNRVTVNRTAQNSTRYSMDEFHLLLKGEDRRLFRGDLDAFQKMGRHTHRDHTERQDFTCFPQGREHF